MLALERFSLLLRAALKRVTNNWRVTGLLSRVSWGYIATEITGREAVGVVFPPSKVCNRTVEQLTSKASRLRLLQGRIWWKPSVLKAKCGYILCDASSAFMSHAQSYSFIPSSFCIVEANLRYFFFPDCNYAPSTWEDYNFVLACFCQLHACQTCTG